MGPLESMLASQLKLQRTSFKVDPVTMTGDERAEFIRWNVLALTDELHEMLAEVGWKPWADSRHVNANEAFGEMIDAWHFFMNILLVLEGARLERLRLSGESVMVPDLAKSIASRLAVGYARKHDVNVSRQADGYDGVTGKCPKCHRDLAEVELREFTTDQGTHIRYCPCGGVITSRSVDAEEEV